MIPELIGAAGLVLAAVITGTFSRMRRENSDAHGRAMVTLNRIATTVDDIDEQLDEITEWQTNNQRFHDERSDEGLDRSGPLHR